MNNEELARVRWLCRRGMLELDIFLRRFVDEHYSSLSTTQRADFERLLAAQDPDLYDWLLGHSQPEDTALAAMVNYIRTALEMD